MKMVRRNILALAAGAGALGMAIAGSAFAADAQTDIMALQTAASIENLAVAVYTTAAGLPFIKSGNATVLAFITKTGIDACFEEKPFALKLLRGQN